MNTALAGRIELFGTADVFFGLLRLRHRELLAELPDRPPSQRPLELSAAVPLDVGAPSSARLVDLTTNTTALRIIMQGVNSGATWVDVN